MKSQIALLGLGIVIAGGVSYAELKPASNNPSQTSVSTPAPVDSSTPSAAASTAPTKIATPTKSTAPKITNPSVSGGGGDDDEREHEEDEEDDD